MPTQKPRYCNETKATNLFVDLDGTLVFHNYNPLEDEDVFLPGAVEWLKDAREKGYYIVLTTARIPLACESTLRALKEQGFVFDRLLCELPSGVRVLINDEKVKGVTKAIAHNIPRNVGIGVLKWIL